MATVKDIMALMEDIAPLSLSDAYVNKYGGYDNSGLLLGSPDKQVFTVLCCLDVTGDVVIEAEEINADMIISHHPFIYGGLNKIITNEVPGKSIARLLKNGTAVYSAHLNLDVAPYGVSQMYADRLGIECQSELQPIDAEDAGLGRLGTLEYPMTLSELARRAAQITGDTHIRTVGDVDRSISTVAVACGGCGGDTALMQQAQSAGAEVMITSEIKHHAAIFAKEIGLCLIESGHYYTEYLAMETICGLLAKYAEQKGMDAEFMMSAVCTNPFND